MKQRFRDCAKKKRELERETGRAVTYEEALNAMGLHPAAVAGTVRPRHSARARRVDAMRFMLNSSMV